MPNYGRFNSSNTPDVAEGVALSKGNPITISSLSELLSVDGVLMLAPNSAVEDYMDYIMENAVEMDLPEELWYRPEALAESLYGTPDLFYLVMLMNGASSAADFKMAKVKVLDPGSTILDRIVTARSKALAERRARPLAVGDLTIREVV